MRKLFFLFFVLHFAGILLAQNSADSLKNIQNNANADDPSQFFTRIEVFNELERYKEEDFYLNQTVVRTVLKIGKRFTTRLDLPFVYSSLTSAENQQQSGMGDISFRLLGYKIVQKPNSALISSIEISLNTAESPILGTGKNLIIPMITYTHLIPKEKILLALTFQQANSVGGDEERDDISFSKLQMTIIKRWSQKVWTVLQPECYIDYVHGGVSLNLRSRMVYAPAPRINIWVTPSIGIFGEFIGIYQWSADIGCRYYLFRK